MGAGEGVCSPQGPASVPPRPLLERRLLAALATPGNHGMCVCPSFGQPSAASAPLGSLTPRGPPGFALFVRAKGPAGFAWGRGRS